MKKFIELFKKTGEVVIAIYIAWKLGSKILEKKIKLGVVGMQGSGKTQLYASLKGEKYNGEATNTENYPEFEFKFDNKKIKVDGGKDIGGGEEFVDKFYLDWLKEKDLVVMVFDINKYLEDNEYQKGTNARFDTLNKHQNDGNAKIVLLGSHLDTFEGSEADAIRKMRELLKNKKYVGLILNGNIHMANLTEIESVREIISKYC